MSMQDFLFSLKLTIKILTGTHWVFCDQCWWTLEPHVSLLFTLLQPHRSRWWGLKVNAGESWGVDSGLISETLQHTESDLNVPDSSLFLIGKLVRIEHAYLQKKWGFQSFISACCGKISWQKHFKEERTSWGSQLKAITVGGKGTQGDPPQSASRERTSACSSGPSLSIYTIQDSW